MGSSQRPILLLSIFYTGFLFLLLSLGTSPYSEHQSLICFWRIFSLNLFLFYPFSFFLPFSVLRKTEMLILRKCSLSKISFMILVFSVLHEKFLPNRRSQRFSPNVHLEVYCFVFTFRPRIHF